MLENFIEFKTIKELMTGKYWEEIPVVAGVYVVVYKNEGRPKFEVKGSGPELWRDKTVNVHEEELISKWIMFKDGDDKILYIGRAGGKNTKTNLQKRIKQYISFGLGHQSPHYGGRYIWQIVNPEDMVIYWEAVDHPAEREKKLLDKFKKEHNQRLPFANLKGGDIVDVGKIISNPIFTSGIILHSNSVHGLSHWKKVEKFGLKIAKINGADKRVISLFSYLHDARRENEDDDPGHGERAVSLLDELINKNIIDLTATQYQQLSKALSAHNKYDAESDDITVKTCWDADRLDLWRCGFIPNPKLMFTDYGKSKKMIEYAKKLNGG